MRIALPVSLLMLTLWPAMSSAAEVDPSLGPADVQRDWTVVGTGAEGRSLYVASTTAIDFCRVPRVDQLPAAAGELRLRLVTRIVEPLDCGTEGAERGVVVLKVSPKDKLEGQSISGPQMVAPSVVYPQLTLLTGEIPIRSIVGLRPELAVSILRAVGFKAVDVRLRRRGANKYVDAVAPKLPKIFDRSFKLTLTTR